MRVLSKACFGASCCPGVSDPEDDSGELIIVGHDETGAEVAIRIDRRLVEQAIAELQKQSRGERRMEAKYVTRVMLRGPGPDYTPHAHLMHHLSLQAVREWAVFHNMVLWGWDDKEIWGEVPIDSPCFKCERSGGSGLNRDELNYLLQDANAASAERRNQEIEETEGR